MRTVIRLRRGERLNPAEFSAEFLELMHARLDAIAVEQRRGVVRERVEAVLSWVMGLLAGAALVLMVALCVAEGLGWL